jgi:hypothetical protein
MGGVLTTRPTSDCLSNIRILRISKSVHPLMGAIEKKIWVIRKGGFSQRGKLEPHTARRLPIPAWQGKIHSILPYRFYPQRYLPSRIILMNLTDYTYHPPTSPSTNPPKPQITSSHVGHNCHLASLLGSSPSPPIHPHSFPTSPSGVYSTKLLTTRPTSDSSNNIRIFRKLYIWLFK